MELLRVLIVVAVVIRLLPKLAELYMKKGEFYCNRSYLIKKKIGKKCYMRRKVSLVEGR